MNAVHAESRISRILSYIIVMSSVLIFALNIGAADARFMIIGNDEKITWDDQGKTLKLPSVGKDTISIANIGTNPEAPKIIKNIPLMNSIYGPPTNMIITPDMKLALVANSVDWKEKGGKWDASPDNKLYLIDLEGEPRHIDTIEVGKQPSGMDLNSQGNLLLIANRADTFISVVEINGKKAKLVSSVEVGEETAAVSFTPDGKHAFFIKKQQSKVGVLHIKGQEVTYNSKKDINVGVAPYNIAVSPKGDIALVNNIGVTGGNDGNIDTVSVIDITAKHPHTIDSIAVGDGPEGLAFSPSGDLAVSVLIRGSQSARSKPETAWAYHKNGSVAVLKIDGKKVEKISEVEVGIMPEGVVFSPDGKYIYVGNFLSKDISILKVNGTEVVNTGNILKLNGSPAAMRGVKK